MSMIFSNVYFPSHTFILFAFSFCDEANTLRLGLYRIMFDIGLIMMIMHALLVFIVIG